MNRISTIELAIKNEKREMDFYLNEAKHSLNPMARYMFETLAADEQDHINLLRRIQGELVKNGTWPGDVSVTVGEKNILKTLRELAKRRGSSDGHVDSDVDALRKSVLFEGEAADFYEKAANESESSEEATFFNYLSKIERDHMSAIKDTLLYLENPSEWETLHNGEASGNNAP